jgi:hypothetical protein
MPNNVLIRGSKALRVLRALWRARTAIKKAQQRIAEIESHPGLTPEMVTRLNVVKTDLSGVRIRVSLGRIVTTFLLLRSNKSEIQPNGSLFLLDMFLTKTDRETIPGDLQEVFTTSILPKYGARRAHLWFWAQTMQTIATRNPISRWVLVYGLGRLIDWLFRTLG